MDGAIILAGDASRIACANVHLMPEHLAPPHGRTGGVSIPCAGSIAVSEAMATIAVMHTASTPPSRPAG